MKPPYVLILPPLPMSHSVWWRCCHQQPHSTHGYGMRPSGEIPTEDPPEAVKKGLFLMSRPSPLPGRVGITQTIPYLSTHSLFSWNRWCLTNIYNIYNLLRAYYGPAAQHVLSSNLHHLNEVGSVILALQIRNPCRRTLAQEYIDSKWQSWNSHSFLSGSQILLFVIPCCYGPCLSPQPKRFNIHHTSVQVHSSTSSNYTATSLSLQLLNQSIKIVSQLKPGNDTASILWDNLQFCSLTSWLNSTFQGSRQGMRYTVLMKKVQLSTG